MINAFTKAVVQLGDIKILKYLFICVTGAALALAVLWASVTGALTYFVLGALPEWITWISGGETGWFGFGFSALIGGLMTFMLFPAAVSVVVPLFLDGIAAAVEARHYPGLPPARGQPFLASIFNALRFLAAAAGLNLMILAVLFIPVVNLAAPLLFYGVNGCLLGREYFEVVALRRLNARDADEMRRARRYSTAFAGIITAFLLTIPLINLIAPVIAAAAMVHLFHSWRGGARLGA